MTEQTVLDFFPAARLDTQRLRRAWQGSTAMTAPEGLLAQMGQQLLERLDDIKLVPGRILELGDRTGLLARQLQRRWPKADIYALTFTESLARQGRYRTLPWQRHPRNLVGSADALPFARGQFDLVISNMALHWSPDLPAALREIRRVLAPDRLLLFTVAGSESLWELHACLTQVDQTEYGRSWVRRPELPSLSGLGHLLSASGFVLPVADRDRAVLSVPDLPWLLRQLKALGAGNHMHNRPGHGLAGKTYLEKLEQAYRAGFRQPDNSLPCTIELLFGHAWKGADKTHT
ncbi:MAG: methyltransferase domain-containing protein [Magnetococcales bacterium]|nr:methyltransferase domain-containing protein [Magnetococcales bacterium]